MTSFCRTMQPQIQALAKARGDFFDAYRELQEALRGGDATQMMILQSIAKDRRQVFEKTLEDCERRQLQHDMRELFREEFFDVADVQEAFTIGGHQLITIAPDEEREAYRRLRHKVARPEVRQLLAYLKLHPGEAANWALVYQPQAQIHSLTDGQDGESLSIRSIATYVERALRGLGEPQSLWSAALLPLEEGVLLRYDFTHEYLSHGWTFQRITEVADTQERTRPDQRNVLHAFLQTLGITPDPRYSQYSASSLFFALVLERLRDLRHPDDIVRARVDFSTHVTFADKFVVIGLDQYGLRLWLRPLSGLTMMPGSPVII